MANTHTPNDVVNPCPICKATMMDHHEHVIAWTRLHDDTPLSFVISLQGYYDNTAAHSRVLALARRELKQYFPGNKFEIQPARMMMRKDSENSIILGEAYVATYVAFEV